MAGYFYILANATNEVLYKGSTNDLVRRMYEHKQHLHKDSLTIRITSQDLCILSLMMT